MQNIKRRIAALETATAPADEITLIRLYVRPGHLDAAITRLRDDEGKVWMRQAGETEQQLIDRATLEVKRTPWSVASLTADDMKEPQADH